MGQGSPIRSRVEDDEDMLSRVTACDVLQLHSVSSLATDSEKLGVEPMNLEHWEIDSAVNRDRITEWVREENPAFNWKSEEQDVVTYSIYMWTLSVTG